METFSKAKKEAPKQQIYYVNGANTINNNDDEIYDGKYSTRYLETTNFSSTHNLINNYEVLNNNDSGSTYNPYNTCSTSSSKCKLFFFGFHLYRPC
jgi:hypothetical protein